MVMVTLQPSVAAGWEIVVFPSGDKVVLSSTQVFFPAN